MGIGGRMTDIKDILKMKHEDLLKEKFDKDMLILADIVIDLYLAQRKAKNNSLHTVKTISYTESNKTV